MFGTYEKYTLLRIYFARRASNTFIMEDYYKPGQLRLGNNWTWAGLFNDYTFDIKLTVNGAPVQYSYYADESSVRIEGCGASRFASAEIALTDRSFFRIRGKNAGVRLELRSGIENGCARACRGMYALPDGSGWEGEFGRFGKLFFKALSGNYTVTSVFDEEKNECSLLRVDFIPDAVTGLFDAAIHDYRDNILPFGEYEDFDELIANNYADFAEFRKIYREPASGYEEMTKIAEWLVWSHRTKAIGTFKQPHILGMYLAGTAASWHQSYHAMPMLNDLKEAWRQICVMFLYQDKRTGRVPNGGIAYTILPKEGMQPAFQGFALDYIIRNMGDDFITREEAERMYPKMAAWANYWTTYRNAGLGNDLIALRNPHESGWDDSSLFKEGFPVVDPCACTFIILLMEAVALMAKKSFSYNDKQEEWDSRAKNLTEIIINEYWDGERFISRFKGKPVDSYSLANYQPIILGKRLPQHIIDKCAEKLIEEGVWLTEIGMASESMLSGMASFGFPFVLGRVIVLQNMIISVGLQAAGKQREADIIARRMCDHINRQGMNLGFAPYNYYKHNGEKADQQIPPNVEDSWLWTSWPANSYLTMVTGVIGK